MKDVAQEVLAAFQAEHKDQLLGIRAFLDAVGAVDSETARLKLEDAFRLAHSLKGGARVCDLSEIETLGHLMESMLARVRDGVMAMDAEATATLHQALNAIEDWMAELGASRSPETQAEVDEAASRLSALCAAQKPSEPPAHDPRTPEPAEPPTPPVAVTTPDQQSIRVRTDLLDEVLRLADELTIESSRQANVTDQLESLTDCVKELVRESELMRRSVSSVTRSAGTTLDLARLAAHHDLLDQRIRRTAKTTDSLKLMQSSRSWAAHLLCDRLQRHVRDLRMVSAENIFQGFRKMMRDVARAEGKEVEFEATGMNVFADRSVLEQLKDPVMHILRNSIAHGIEPPAERRRRGKSPAGRVTLDIRSVGQRLILKISDDGAGVNRQKVLSAAQEGNWLPQLPSGQTDTAIQQVLFRPGFTTRGDVDRLAGRGMGLSIVHETVTRLQGEVRFLDAGQQGTTVQVNVPLTIGTHRVLVVGCSQCLVCIPLQSVDRLVRVSAEAIQSVEGRPTITLDEDSLPLHWLADLLGAGMDGDSPAVDAINVVILRSAHARRAVVVDRFVDEREAIVQRIGGPARDLPEYSGAILLDDGSVGMLLNVVWLMDARPSDAQMKKAAPHAPSREQRERIILIADDSFTTRTLERSILETRGYQVKLAVDGLDALSQLRSEPVDLVVSDVQMPRMDGLRLLEEMKRDERLSRIPVILVTSMDQCEHRERGLNLGADAYIVKQKFDHDNLLATIERLIEPALW